MHKADFSSIIVLGPCVELYPFVTGDTPKFALPFLNKSLLQHSIEYLGLFSKQIFIMCLEKYKGLVISHTNHYKYPIEIITTENFEGMSYIFNILKSKLKSPNVIFCKGDTYNMHPLKPLLENFVASEDDMHLSTDVTNKGNPVISYDQHGIIFSYNTDQIPFIRNKRLLVTTECLIKDFYIFKSSILNNLPDNMFGFKNNILPYLIMNSFQIRMIDCKNFQVRNLNDFISQLEFKDYIILDDADTNMMASCIDIQDAKSITDNIIGSKTSIGKGSSVRRSIIMDNVKIGENCIIDHCIIGNNVKIYSNSSLTTSKITHNYNLSEPIHIIGQSFHLE